MPSIYHSTAAALLLLCGQAGADIYTCQGADGRKSIQDTPCDHAVTLRVNSEPPDTPEMRAEREIMAQGRVAQMREEIDNMQEFHLQQTAINSPNPYHRMNARIALAVKHGDYETAQRLRESMIPEPLPLPPIRGVAPLSFPPVGGFPQMAQPAPPRPPMQHPGTLGCNGHNCYDTHGGYYRLHNNGRGAWGPGGQHCIRMGTMLNCQ